MANSIASIFAEQNCSYPYFVVTGMTLDNIVSDELTISDVKLQLHHHLIAQGFDAVIFYDPVHMLHFYDAQSSFVMRNYFVPTPDQLRQALRRDGDAQQPPAQPRRSVFRHHGRQRQEQTPHSAIPTPAGAPLTPDLCPLALAHWGLAGGGKLTAPGGA